MTVLKEMPRMLAKEIVYGITLYTKEALALEEKIERYPEQRFYEVGSHRQLLVEKRNEKFNQVLALLGELNKYAANNGRQTIELPPMLRIHQADATKVKRCIAMFYAEQKKMLKTA